MNESLFNVILNDYKFRFIKQFNFIEEYLNLVDFRSNNSLLGKTFKYNY